MCKHGLFQLCISSFFSSVQAGTHPSAGAVMLRAHTEKLFHFKGDSVLRMRDTIFLELKFFMRWEKHHHPAQIPPFPPCPSKQDTRHTGDPEGTHWPTLQKLSLRFSKRACFFQKNHLLLSSLEIWTRAILTAGGANGRRGNLSPSCSSISEKKTVSVLHKFFENEYRAKGTSYYFPPPQTAKQRDALKTSLLMLLSSYTPSWEHRLPQ